MTRLRRLLGFLRRFSGSGGWRRKVGCGAGTFVAGIVRVFVTGRDAAISNRPADCGVASDVAADKFRRGARILRNSSR